MADNISITPEAQKAIRDRDQRIAELEEYLRSWVETADQFATRAVAAEAKLGRVKAWSESDEVQAIIGFCESVYMESVLICSGSPSKICWHWIRDAVGEAHVKTINDLDAILSDTTPPLAVVHDSVKRCGGDMERTEYCVYFDVPVPVDDSEKYLSITATILPRESEGE